MTATSDDQTYDGNILDNDLLQAEQSMLSAFHAVTTGQAFILKLPDELLVSIVKLATCGPRSPAECAECSSDWDVAPWDVSCIKSLSRVCRRLQRIAQPLLFRAISFKYPIEMVPPSKPVIKLHHTLRKNPGLRQYCRFLHIHIPDIGSKKEPDIYLIARDFADWLTGIRCLSIHGGFEGDQEGHIQTWALIRRIVDKCDAIEHLTISREAWGLYLGPILRWLNLSKLKKLEIHGISNWKHGFVELEPEKRRTAPFTSLRLSDYGERLESTSLLLQWPAALIHFELCSFYNNPHVFDYPMVESWLLIHRETLKSVNIGYLSRWRGSNRLFNATLFPNLEFMKLSRWQMKYPLRFEAEDANVLGPSLKTFGWDFNIYDQDNEGWSDFGEAEVSWICELVKIAVARKATLKTIKIQFSPERSEDTEEMGYPWDRMDDLRDQVLRSNGMDLVYNTPYISKEDWLEGIKAQNAESEEWEGVFNTAATEPPHDRNDWL